MRVRFKHPEYSDIILNQSVSGILAATQLCAIATIRNKARSHIHTAYFAYNNHLELFFLSDPKSQHCVNIQVNPGVAVAVFSSRQGWARRKRGLQMFGTCAAALGRKKAEAEYRYGERFGEYRRWMKTLSAEERSALKSRFYVIKVTAMKIFDEPLFGEEVFIPISLNKG